MKNIFITLLLLLTLDISAFNSLMPDLTDAQKELFNKQSYLKESDVKYKDGFRLIPKDYPLKSEFLQEVNEYKPELCIELLFEFDKPNFEGEKLTKFLQENILAVSDQVGIEYFSFNRNKMYPLIEKSYMVESYSNKKKKISDPVINEVQELRRYTLFQKDSTFGSNYYSLISRTKNGIIWNQMDNITDLSVFKIFKALDEGSLRVDYMIIPNQDKLLLYSVVQIKDPPKVENVLGKKVNIPDSVRKRIQAIIEWYIKKIT